MDDTADIAELRSAVDGFTANTTEALTSTRKDVEALTKAVEKLELRMNRPGVASSFRGDGDLDRERKAVGAFVRNGDDAELKAVSTLEVGVDPAGGYVVLPQMSKTMIKRIWDQSPIRRLARVVTIETGDAWQEPIDDDDAIAEWVGERQARPVLDAPELGLLTVPLSELFSNVKVTQKLLDLSFHDIGQWVEGKLADRFARSENEAYVKGNAVGKPQGFLSLATSTADDFTRPRNTLQHVMSGAPETITVDGLKDFYWALRAAHRGNAVWLMASATANTLDKLKNDGGDYLWRDSSTAGAPPTLLGREVLFCEDMPAVGAGAYPVAFGDFQAGYLILDRAGIRFLRDPYSDKPHVHIYAYRRTGGGVANADAIKLLKVGA